MPGKKAKDLADRRSAIIQSLLDKLENNVQAAQRDLFKTVLSDFVDGLEVDEAGNVKNTIANKRRFSMFENVFTRFAQSKGLEVVKSVTDGISKLVDFNEQYFSAWHTPAVLAPIQAQVKETISAWLGVTQRGKIEPNGYLNTLVKSEQVRNGIKNIVLKTVVSQGGYQELKKTLQNHIEGNKEQTGALQRYYRNFAYDTFSVVDRTAGKITADKLKMNYAIYEGGLVEASRKFCKDHNGKVFSRDEIADFLPTEAIGPGYDPFVDLGGFGCRHHLNWIPDTVAFALRPDLKDKEPAQVEPPKPEEKPAPAEEKTFTPAETPKEAKQKAVALVKENLGLNITTVRADKTLTLENFNKRLEQLHGLTNDYDISPLYSKKSEIKLSFNSGARYAGFIKTYHGGEDILEINFGHSRSNYRVKEGVTDFSQIDAGNEEIATLTHEFAHLMTIDNQYSAAVNKAPEVAKFWNELRSIRSDYTADLMNRYKNKSGIEEIHLGRYAGTNANEFMAEAFTEYKLKAKASPYAIKVGKLIDKYFKRKK